MEERKAGNEKSREGRKKIENKMVLKRIKGGFGIDSEAHKGLFTLMARKD